MDLFENNFKENKPLAERMRPASLENFVGQEHIIGKGRLLNRAIMANKVGSCIFWGPPGTGKTTLASIIASVCKGKFAKLNAVSSGVADAKKIMDEAKREFELYGTRTYLLLDECHRWNKAQSDSVLAAIEQGYIIFIGSTTENPYFSMTRAIVSRCTVFEFKRLSENDIKSALLRAINDDENGFGKLKLSVDDKALSFICDACGGDLRAAYNALELAVLTTEKNKKGEIVIDLDIAQESIQQKALSLDENTFYEILSAFAKSIRGCDTEAALYYCARLIEAGCDAETICRRLIAQASEDIGMADSNALLLACSALYAIKNIGLPEGLLPLNHAIIYFCEAAKSNSVYMAMLAAQKDAKECKDDNIPLYLCNNRPEKKNYKYPHNFGGYVKQQYMPDSLKDRVYYKPSKNGKEANLVRKKIK